MVIWHAIFRERCCHDQFYGAVPLIHCTTTQLCTYVRVCVFVCLLARYLCVCVFQVFAGPAVILFLFSSLLSFVCNPLFLISVDALLNFPFARAKPLNLCHCVFLTYLDYIRDLFLLTISLVCYSYSYTSIYRYRLVLYITNALKLAHFQLWIIIDKCSSLDTNGIAVFFSCHLPFVQSFIYVYFMFISNAVSFCRLIFIIGDAQTFP